MHQVRIRYRSQFCSTSLHPKTFNVIHSRLKRMPWLPIHLFSSSSNKGQVIKLARVEWWQSISLNLSTVAKDSQRPAKWLLQSDHKCRNAKNRLILTIANSLQDWCKLRAHSPRRPGSSMRKTIIGARRDFKAVRKSQKWCIIWERST